MSTTKCITMACVCHTEALPFLTSFRASASSSGGVSTKFNQFLKPTTKYKQLTTDKLHNLNHSLCCCYKNEVQGPSNDIEMGGGGSKLK